MSTNPVVLETKQEGPCKETEIPLSKDSCSLSGSATPPSPEKPCQQDLTTFTTLVISNLEDTVSRDDIYELYKTFGPLEHVAMVAPGVAEVTYRYKDDALEACKKYNQVYLNGMKMMCRLQSGGNE